MSHVYRVVMVSPTGRPKVRIMTTTAFFRADFDEFVRGEHDVVGSVCDDRFILVDKNAHTLYKKKNRRFPGERGHVATVTKILLSTAHCHTCKKATPTQVCAACERSFYCSTECLQKDFKVRLYFSVHYNNSADTCASLKKAPQENVPADEEEETEF